MKVGIFRGQYGNASDLATFARVPRPDLDCCFLTTRPFSFPYRTIQVQTYLEEEIAQESRAFDVIEAPESFHPWTQFLVSHHPKPIAMVWDNLPANLSKGAGTYLMRAKKIICRSQMAADTMLFEGCKSSQLEVVPAGVGLDLFHPPESTTIHHLTRIGFAARLVPEKGLQDLICAVKGLEVELQVCGSGDPKPYMDLAAELKVPIRYWGLLKTAEVAVFMQNLDIFVSPMYPLGSWVEQGGSSVLEALATGIPTVLSWCGSHVEYFPEGVQFFPPRNWNLLRNILVQLIHDPTARCQLGEAGLKYCREHYSNILIGNRLAEIYLSVGAE